MYMNEQKLTELRNFLKGKGYTQNKIAEMLGVSRVVVSSLLNGKEPFGKKRALHWAKVFGLSPEWLMYGTGTMLNTGTIEQSGTGNKIGGVHMQCCPSDDEIKSRLELLEKENEMLAAANQSLLEIIKNLTK